MSQAAASALFLALLVLALVGVVIPYLGGHRAAAAKSLVTGDVTPGRGPQSEKLFVLVHGFLGDSRKIQQQWTNVEQALLPFGDVLPLRYPAWRFSNTDPDRVVRDVRQSIQHTIRQADPPYKHIVLVGHSIGSLMVRRAFLDELPEGAEDSWASMVERIVLLAGMNRGWDVSGQKPMDMYWYRRVAFWLGSWFGRLTASGKLIRSTETGEPFVQNIRLDWIRYLQNPTTHTPEVVQLLGDIDDIVSQEDNSDLRAAVAPKFVWLRVRGTGHSTILNLTDKSRVGESGFTLGDYRRAKLLLAATGPWNELVRSNEELQYDTDKQVTHIVFVLHGIRDLGKWSANFEKELQRHFRERHDHNDKLAVVSVRYGFFGMGQFLLNASREKYVRWFVDQYTETLARYPNAKRIDFVGHSNGTYLLARALQRYRAMKVDHVVLAGSVVPRKYEWGTLFAEGRVRSVRNYVAADDWVVALFPRFFESWVMRYFGNEIGSAGFNGFSWEGLAPDKVGEDRQAHNVEFIHGAHSAFLDRVGVIAEYLATDGTAALKQDHATRGKWRVLKVFSDFAVGLVWFGLAAGVVWLGARVTGAAGHPGWPIMLLYLTAVALVLRWV